ncbi:MAG: RNA polymerase sigma factor, partial [Gemmatimonadales bacterium]
MVDVELVRLARQGDRDAFGTLVQLYAGQARRVCLAILANPDDADDAAQDGFLNALENIAKYDPARPFGPWLLRIVANAARDLLRRRNVRVAAELDDRHPGDEVGPHRAAEQSDLRGALGHAMVKLSERQRVALVLFEVEGFSHREIANILQIPVGTARSEVH